MAGHGEQTIEAVRDFNRFYTRVIGVLEEGLLHTPYTLTEARVVFELAQRDRTEVTALRRDLGLDAGYLSRILARFAADGLVTRERAAEDGRRQVVRLSPAGRAVYDTLNARSAVPTAGRRFGAGTAVMAAQLALCTMLLITAGLLGRSLGRLRTVDPGFNPNNVLSAEFRLPAVKYKDDASRAEFQQWQQGRDGG